MASHLHHSARSSSEGAQRVKLLESQRVTLHYLLAPQREILLQVSAERQAVRELESYIALLAPQRKILLRVSAECPDPLRCHDPEAVRARRAPPARSRPEVNLSGGEGEVPLRPSALCSRAPELTCAPRWWAPREERDVLGLELVLDSGRR